MDFWEKESRLHQVADIRRRKPKDLWLQPPKITGGSLPTYGKHTWGTTVSFETDNSSIFSALRSYRLFGYWTGLLPVQGVLGENFRQLHFRWISNATSIPLVFITISVALTGYRIYSGIRYSNVGTFDSAAYLTGLLFWGFFTLRQAIKFPLLIKKWVRVEDEMRSIGSLPKLKRSLDIITILNIAAVLGAISCSLSMWFELISPCVDDIGLKFQLTVVSKFRRKFSVVIHPFSLGVPISFIIGIYHRIIWMFTELTFMVFSYSLYQLFKLYCENLENYRNQDMSEHFWYEMRVRYHSLSRLTKSLDNFLSPNTLVTFAVDIFFACYALYNIFTKNPLEHLKLVYFLVYVIVRILAIAMLASYINDLSKRPLSVLYHIPSHSFCKEILRFQMEILADDVCLTGCRFFSITRSFMIAAVGTVATYEVVLLQFNSLRDEEALSSPSFCSTLASEYLKTTNITLNDT